MHRIKLKPKKILAAKTEEPQTVKLDIPFSDQRPLVIVNGFETDMKCLALDPSNIQKIDVIKEKTAVQEYGSKGTYGVIIITTKPGTEFYTITDFVNPEKNKNKSVTKVQLDGTLLPDMKRFLVDKSVFKQTMISAEVKIDKENCNISTDDTLVVTTTLKEHKE